ncbi:MAG TPA: hypothetical protein VG960_01535 [Caulobacteraceae bacterium]|nr:hypothetical protein [Caulobacteraceae bacterium]
MDGDKHEAERKWRLKSPIPLGQAVAVAGVVIAALGLYVSYAQRQADKQQAELESQQRAQAQSILVLRGEGEGGRIRLIPANPDQVVQSQAIYFPAALRGGPVHITGDGRIDAGWFADGLKRALHGAADDGAERDLTVGVSTTFVQGGQVMTDNSLYQLGFTVHPRLLQGAEVSIEGIALGRRAVATPLQNAVDEAWVRQMAPKP